MKKGGVAVFPTETVYGLGASSLHFSACEKIYQIKKRPPDNPMIVHCRDIREAEIYGKLPNQGRMLWEKFAPGPLTLVLSCRRKDIFTSGLDTIAIRIPSHKKFREILEHLDGPISAPSANLSGKPSITRESDALREFNGIADAILIQPEYPPYTVTCQGLESTVLDLTAPIPRLLRPGSIEKQEMERVLGSPIEVPALSEGVVLSPGTKYRHYSPDATVRIFIDPQNLEKILQSSKLSPEQVSILCYMDTMLPENLISCRILRVNSNQDYARNLYSFFLDSDLSGKKMILCERPHSGELFSALINRLEKAQEYR